MTAEQRRISFLNKYFVFKKIRNVDAKSVKIETEDEQQEEKEKESKKNDKKVKKKIRLVE